MTDTPERSTEANGPLLLHIDQVAMQLGLSRYQTRNLIKAGRLPAEKVGGRTYIPAAAVERYVSSIGAA